MTPTFENLLWEERERLVTITVNRPKALNALNIATMLELERAFQEVRRRMSELGAVILTGAGEKAFVAGADIAELAEFDRVGGETGAARGQAIFTLIETTGIPVIAALNGFALGGGCELALASTLRIAAENARIGLPEVKLGLIPGYGGTQRLARIVGRGRALELILTGEPISAAEALAMGLVNKVVPRENLLAEAEALARAIMSRGPLAVRLVLEAVRRGNDLPLAAGLELEATCFGMACGTRDAHEGMRAFMEKRAAQFEGK
jgi:enoyl-CoA hydratase